MVTARMVWTATTMAARCRPGMCSVRSVFIQSRAPNATHWAAHFGNERSCRSATNLEIIADNYAPDRVYVERVELNGIPLDRWWIAHDEIQNGGTLRFVMSDQPAGPSHP